MEENEETGMDTTYVGILLVVFLVVVALAVDIGYLYVSEDDLHNAANTSALAGAQAMAHRIQLQARTDPKLLGKVVTDTVQTVARTAAIDHVSGHHKAAALMTIANNDTNRLTTTNDLTVGFWSFSSQSYTPGGTPVNAIQVRTRRTAESEAVGLGSVGTLLARLSGSDKLNYTPEAIAAFPARADAPFAVCAGACDTGCTYPDVCTIAERKMVRGPAEGRNGVPAANRYAYSSLSYPPSGSSRLSDLVCMEMPPQDVCGTQIFTVASADDSTLRDLESMMYNPNVGKENKDYDKRGGTLKGWWVIAPVIDCATAKPAGDPDRALVTRYALIRISRICAAGATGCSQNGTAFDAPASECTGEDGLYIDHISCINCGSKDMQLFPGLHPVLVK